MNALKIGRLIRKLRLEKNLSQAQLAEKLNLSPKTISKWETGRGCPDSSSWADLSEILGTDIKSIMEGKLEKKEEDIGKLSRAHFYICPHCKNIVFSSSHLDSICCSKHLEKEGLSGKKISLTYEKIGQEVNIYLDHPMEKDNYILFIALVKDDISLIKRLYPEGENKLFLPYIKRADLYAYSTSMGLEKYKIN